MNREEFNKTLDDYLDGNAADPAAFEAKARSCEECGETLRRALALRQNLQDFAVADAPVVADDFFANALASAAEAGATAERQRERRQSWLTGFGSALAACAALFAVFMFFTGPAGDAPNAARTSAVPTVAMTLEEPRTLNLVFAAEAALDDALLTVTLPQGVAIAGLEGQRVVTWTTSLREGRNVLPLTLVATSTGGGELLAKLEHGADDKLFRIELTVA